MATTTFRPTGQKACSCNVYEVLVDGKLAGLLEREYDPPTDFSLGRYTWTYTSEVQGSADNNEYESFQIAQDDLRAYPPTDTA